MSIKEGVTKVVQRIFDQHGSVTAAQLVRAAKPKTSSAHDGFEWDDLKAGNEYRLIQGRNWIKVVRVVYHERKEQFVHVPPSMGGGGSEGKYKVTSVVVSIPDELERAISETMATLFAARRAADHLMSVAQKSDIPDRAAMVAQIAKGLEIMQSALQMVH